MKVKITHKKFCEIFTNRKFTFRERFMQSIWFVDMGSHYEIHQKISILCLILSPLFYIAATPFIFFFNGCFGVVDVWRYFIPYALGKPIRVDMCHHNTESTNALITAAGW